MTLAKHHGFVLFHFKFHHMSKKLFTLLCTLSVLLLPGWLFAQPEPLLYWRFENPQHSDYSNDEIVVDADPTNPATGLANHILPCGPVGNYAWWDQTYYIQERITTPSPTEWNPDGFTMECLMRFEPVTGNAGACFRLDGRFSADFYMDEIQINFLFDCLIPHGQFRIFLNGWDRLDPGYIWDREWHHYALRYSWDEALGQGKLTVFIDGLSFPQMSLTLHDRLAYTNIAGFIIGGAGGPYTKRVDVDEILVYDDAISDVLIYQHYQNFLAGNPYQMTQTSTPLPPALPAAPMMVFDQDDYVLNYDPNNPSAAPSSPTPTLHDQLTAKFPVPRYWMNHSLFRNHPYPGSIGHVESAIEPSTTRNVTIANDFTELYNQWNYSLFVGPSSLASAANLADTSVSVPNNFLGKLVARASTSSGHTWDEVSVSSFWGSSKANSGGPMFQALNMHNIIGGAPSDYYCVDQNGNYMDWSTGLSCQVGTGSENSLRPDANPLFANIDGDNVGNYLAMIEGQGVDLTYVMEDGEVRPGVMSAGIGTDIRTGSGGGVCTGRSSSTLQASWTTASALNTWPQFVSLGKRNMHAGYRDGMRANSGVSSFSYWCYQLHGGSVWQIDRIFDVNSHEGTHRNTSGQENYSSPDFYIGRAYAWNRHVGGWGGQGISDLLDSRGRELTHTWGPTGATVRTGRLNFCAPSISPGIDRGNNNVPGEDNLETAMMRPGYYLGLLKIAMMAGAEYFVTFQYNESTPNQLRPHDAAWWGWQYSTPSYAQAVVSRMKGWYDNSVVMNGDYAQHIENVPMRFWAGSPNNVVAVRQAVDDITQVICANFDCSDRTGTLTGSAHLEPEYLISGTLQSDVPNTMIPSGSTPTYARNVSIALAGQTLQFEIRKQGSTYFYDYNDPFDPIFYQLDGWHEHSHPMLWSKDIVIEAELFDDQVGVAGPDWLTITRDMADNPITDGDFRAYVTYMQNPAITGSPNPSLDYLFNMREVDNGNVLLRFRDPIGAKIFVDIIDPVSSTVLYHNDASYGTACWEWYDFGNYNAFTNKNYLLRISTDSPTFQLDQIAIVESANVGNYTNSTGTPTADWSFPGNDFTCDGCPVEVTVDFTGTPPWTFTYEENSVPHTINGIFTTPYTLNINPSTTSTLVMDNVADYFCSTGTLLGSTLNATDDANAWTAITPASITLCSLTGSPQTITAPGGFISYLWSTGETTQSINTLTNGVYAALCEDPALNCLSPAGPVVTRACRLDLTSSTGEFIICSGVTPVLDATTFGYAGYQWVLDGTTTVSTSATCTASVAGTYTVTALDAVACECRRTVRVYDSQPVITPIGFQCVSGDTVTLHVSPPVSSGTWSVSPSATGALTTSGTRVIFDPSAYSLASGAVQQITLTYTQSATDCHGCTASTATYTFDLYESCFVPCGNAGPNLVEDPTFEIPTCIGTTGSGLTQVFATDFTEDCSQPLPSMLLYSNNADNSTCMSGYAAATEHGCIPSSLMPVGICTSSPRKIWGETISVTSGNQYAWSLWARGFDNVNNEDADIIVKINGTTQGTYSLDLTQWKNFGGAYTATSSSATLEVYAERTNGIDAFIAVDDISFVETTPSITVDGPTEVCINFPYSLQPGLFVANNGFASYLWTEVSPGSVTVGTTQAITISPASAGSYIYRVRGITASNCTTYVDFPLEAVTGCLYKRDGNNAAGASAEAPTARFSIFPNPNSGRFTLKGDLSEARDFKVRVSTMHGVTIFAKSYAGEEGTFSTDVDLSGVTNGVYFLTVEGTDSREVFKVVKQ